MAYTKLPAIKSKHIGCLCCGGAPNKLPMKTRLYNGFGGWQINKNDEFYFIERVGLDSDKCKKLSEIEKEAEKEPDNDWQAVLLIALRGATYQRQNNKNWVLVEENKGFA